MQLSSQNFLVIFAHPENNSFCGALKNKTLSILHENKKSTFLSDLYAMEFNPSISSKDYLPLPLNASPISLEEKQMKSSETNIFDPEISLELEKIMKSEFLIFIAPMYWGSVPAILKGWFDRVLVRGKAWDINKWHETGLLKGKKALLVITTASGKEDFQKGNFQNISLEEMLHHITWSTFDFCGMDVQKTYCVFGVGTRTREVMDEEITKYGEFMQNICKNK